mgnify:CR=1 FL=1
MEPRISVFVGHFGSGKTEIAINYAIKLAKEGKKVTIVDCDIVNTYFRTLDAKKELELYGIRVIAPIFANSNLEMQMIPPEILSVFEEHDTNVVFDVGGDEDGAYALGMYKRLFEREGYKMMFVVNARRPLTATADDTIEYMVDIEKASRLAIGGVINNTNLADETTADDVIYGDGVVNEISRKTGLEYKMIAADEEVIKHLPKELADKAFAISRYLTLPY